MISWEGSVVIAQKLISLLKILFNDCDFIASSSVALNEVKYCDFASKYVMNLTFSVDDTSHFE